MSERAKYTVRLPDSWINGYLWGLAVASTVWVIVIMLAVTL